jgi:GPI ethanolamine phosphate transferase 2/3 subunit F
MSFLTALRPTQAPAPYVPTGASPRGPHRRVGVMFALVQAGAAPFAAAAAALLTGWHPLRLGLDERASESDQGVAPPPVGLEADPRTPRFLTLCGIFFLTVLSFLHRKYFGPGLQELRAEAGRGRAKYRGGESPSPSKYPLRPQSRSLSFRGRRSSSTSSQEDEDEEYIQYGEGGLYSRAGHLRSETDLEAEDGRRFRRGVLLRFAVLLPVFHFMGVAFGAPLLEDFWHTLGWAALLAVSFAVPGAYSSVCAARARRPVPRGILGQLGEFLALADDTATPEWQLSAWGAALGSWIGALVIPLDWDRPWQRWPVSCVIMALAGHSFGSLVAAVVILLRRHKKWAWS